MFPYLLSFKLFVATLDSLIAIGIAFLLSKPLAVKILIALVALESILYWTSWIFRNAMYAFEVTKYSALTRIVERVWAFTVGGLVLALTRSLTWLIVALVVGYVIRDVMMITFALRFVRVSFKVSGKVWINTLKRSFPFWLIGLFSTIYYRTDVVMLNLLTNDYQTGLYRGALMLIEAAMFIPTVIVNTVMAPMARLHGSDRKLLKLLFNKVFFALFGVGILGVIGYEVFAGFLVKTFFGNKFVPSAPILKVLALAMLPMFLNSLFGSYLNATGRKLEFTKITGITALTNVVLNFVLISYMGARGGSIGDRNKSVPCLPTIV
ncbi:putative polysaccharide biosynthesis protein [Pyrococcus sp. ST04]|nr:putative polysaccharide biosynthesis protein [Pyrococcus sp. ST04]